MPKLTIKKECINKCGHHVILPRNSHGATQSVECGTCKSLGVERSRQQFAQTHRKAERSQYGLDKEEIEE